MCSSAETYEQAVQAVEHVLFEEKDGKSRFEREIEAVFYKGIGRWLLGGGVVIIIAVSGIYFQVKANTYNINEGGRYTQEEADVDKANQHAINERLERKLDIIIEQTRN